MTQIEAAHAAIDDGFIASVLQEIVAKTAVLNAASIA
jgi:RimJ/RimL family protein N-acetyltransferase